MILLIIINCVFMLINFISAYQINKKQENQNFQFQSQINSKKMELSILQEQLSFFVEQIKKEKDYLNKINYQISEQLEKKQDKINNYYNVLKEQALSSFNQYFDTIDKSYKEKEKQYNLKIENIKKQQQQVEDNLFQIKQIYQAAVDAHLREKEQKDKKLFYQLQITENQILDIYKLQEWKKELKDPSIISKLIWSSYIMKPTSDLCNRVLGSNSVCGIYKITNILTNDVYIGQSVNISDRWKTHIKSGLGIDASPTNKLYNNMQQHGVWNFSFEVLQKCSREKLNEKESFWIEMYQSNKIGMNLTKGNK